MTAFQSRSSIYLLFPLQKKKKESRKKRIFVTGCAGPTEKEEEEKKEEKKDELEIKFGSIVVTLTDMQT